MSASFVPVTTGAAAAAAHRRMIEEEENLTPYNKGDLDGWEFKIVRSGFGRFRKPEVIQELCRREAEAGWEMLEKFDSQRIRFKRRIEHRSRDGQLGYDAYRTCAGGFDGSKARILIVLAVMILGVIVYFMRMSQ